MEIMNILTIKVDDTERTREKNEKYAIKEAGFTGRVPETDLETFKITGRPSEDLMNLLTVDEVEDLVANIVTSIRLAKRYSLEEKATIRDLMDAIPMYASVVITFKRTLENAVEEYRLALNRRGSASRELEEFRVIALDLTAYEYWTEE